MKTYEVTGLKNLEKVVVHFQKVSYDSFTGECDRCENESGVVLGDVADVSK